ncbi:carbohydrate ABC transporter permease [Aerococcaceae bacterium zg-ZJ1578]|uniref:carbohydrate ABC transporter permease n=1 Tax=Aerococcaceae bacterium zg-252 TaxID=2796928 RepID=UPI001A2BE532|nr:carbohydrate ABC transporter permease [Aerococcaceae bacterium zg-1578]MBR7927539.1 carbohydrate ABC transporter permease [Aerococcaceae bacterium zg-ZUI334]
MTKQKYIQSLSNILLFIFGAIWLYPFYIMVVNALKNRKEIFGNPLGVPTTLTFKNFIAAFEALDFVKSFCNSAIITIGSIILMIILPAMAAYALSRGPKKLSNKIYTGISLTMLVPFQAIMIPLISLAGKMNLLNKSGLMLMYLGLGSSMAIFLYFGALKGIPKSLDEAARIDGANAFQVFFKIIFPMLKPTTVTVIVLNSIWFWNDYLLPSLVINRPETHTIPLKMFYFFGAYSTQWDLALAGLIIAIVPIIILYAFLQKYIIEGISDGAVK